jgi:hypothetical protein
MIFRTLVCWLLLLVSLHAAGQPESVQTLIRWLLQDDKTFQAIPFSEVIAATSGKKVLAFDAKDEDDQRILKSIHAALDAALLKLNAPDSPAQKVKRINEASHFFEDEIRTQLNLRPGFSCDFPRTAAGRVLRSGYPDLRLVDKATGRVVYLDPKLYAKGSEGSSFRTFYFEPRGATNKVNDDARHLIVGIQHERTATGWNFEHWRLIDLAHFRVHLKAEFEGSNADMYQPAATVEAGP